MSSRWSIASRAPLNAWWTAHRPSSPHGPPRRTQAGMSGSGLERGDDVEQADRCRRPGESVPSGPPDPAFDEACPHQIRHDLREHAPRDGHIGAHLRNAQPVRPGLPGESDHRPDAVISLPGELQPHAASMSRELVRRTRHSTGTIEQGASVTRPHHTRRAHGVSPLRGFLAARPRAPKVTKDDDEPVAEQERRRPEGGDGTRDR